MSVEGTSSKERSLPGGNSTRQLLRPAQGGKGIAGGAVLVQYWYSRGQSATEKC
jgi:hypothetical protein